MGKNNILPTISIFLISLMIIAVPSFAFFEDIGDGAGDFFNDVGTGAGDFFDDAGIGAGDFSDDIDGAAGADDFFGNAGTGSSGSSPESTGSDAGPADGGDEIGSLDDDDDFDSFQTGIPGDDDGIEFPPTQPNPENPPKFPPKNAIMDISIKDSNDPVEPGTVFTYTINYVNGGFVDANDVSLAVMYDNKAGYSNAAPKPTEGIDRWTFGKILPQKGGVVKIDVVVRGNAKDGDVITFKANLKYTDSATGKQHDVSASESTRVRVSQPTPQPEPNTPTKTEQEGVSLKILSTRFPLTAEAGNAMPIYLTIENNGNEKLEDTTITVLNQETAIRASIGPFDLGKGKDASKMLLLRIPENTPEGTYMLRFTISSNSQIRRVVYRELDII